MGAPISIVIPTLNAEKGLMKSLPALMEGLPRGLIREVIISDGGSDDQTQRLADQSGAVFITGEASRGGQLRRGAEIAKGDWFLFLHADTELSQGWSEVIERHLASNQPGYGKLQFAGGGLAGKVVACWANLRSRLFGLPYGDQTLLIPRSLYQKIGGFQDIPLMEDVAMARSLKGRLAALEYTARTSPERYKRNGWLRRGGRNIVILTRYLLGASPERLAEAYRR